MLHLEPVMMVLEAFVSPAKPRLHVLLASQPSFALRSFLVGLCVDGIISSCVTQSGAVCWVIHAPDSSAGSPACFVSPHMVAAGCRGGLSQEVGGGMENDFLRRKTQDDLISFDPFAFLRLFLWSYVTGSHDCFLAKAP